MIDRGLLEYVRQRASEILAELEAVWPATRASGDPALIAETEDSIASARRLVAKATADLRSLSATGEPNV